MCYHCSGAGTVVMHGVFEDGTGALFPYEVDCEYGDYTLIDCFFDGNAYDPHGSVTPNDPVDPTCHQAFIACSGIFSKYHLIRIYCG